MAGYQQVPTPQGHLDIWSLPRVDGEVGDDRWAVAEGGLRFAVADGAGSSPRSGAWAEELTRSWVQRREPVGDDHERAVASARRWLVERCGDGLADDRGGAGEADDWWSQPVAERGAHSTFLGVEVERATMGDVVLRVIAVGDTCAFGIGTEGPREVFPLTHVDQFGPAPDLVSSAPGAAEPVVHATRLRVLEDDRFLVATDALAERLLRGADWPALVLGEGPEVLGLLEGWRQQGDLDDDVTLVRLGRCSSGHGHERDGAP